MTRNLNPKEFSCLNAKLYAFQREFFDSKPEPYFTQVARLPKGDIAYTLLSQDGQSSVSIQKDGISVKHGNTMKAYLVQLPREAPLYNLFHSLKYYTYENLQEALLEILQNRYMDRSAYAKFPLGSKNSVIMLNGVAYTIMDNELDENKTKVITLDRKSVSDRELEIIVPGGCLFLAGN